MGKHQIPTRSLTRIAAGATAASAMAVFCYGTAAAAPGDAPSTQGDVTTAAPSTQGPLTSDAPSTQGELTAPAPAPQAERVYWVAPPAAYDQSEWQTWDAYYDDDETTGAYTDTAPAAPSVDVEPAAPLDVNTLHGPVAVEDPTVPTAAPAKVLKIGDFYDDQPSWLSDEDLERTNNSTAVIQAQVTDFWRSIGVPTDRAQRLGASQIAAGGAGLVTGAVALGAPATIAGALGGGTIGGIAGALAGGLIPIAPGIAPITTGIAGTAGGAALGAAVIGAPATALGAATGLAAGLALGTTYGAGDLGEPQKIDLPDFPQAEPAPAPEAAPPAAPAPLAPTPAPAPVVQTDSVWTEPTNPVETARGFVTTQIGGPQVLDAVDQATAAAAPAFAAIDAAITAAFNPAVPA
ncbi:MULTISPECIES: hypothetical protein [Nocardiaceae]|uniref:hypothetical protein n=1 Tax=Nocardiaceae TaxID=85025 RepID=UPI00068EAAA3|nr:MULTISPECIES: hypothetical protein [Rhodococcus]OZD12043.1 hypothetical protein CH248_29000 [Rhodococcus sp. 06-156-4a]OZD15808.1 hypothetical protein CH253_22880 [Rhodococcus sp. 06-156-3C]OZD21191.1 hypothetical protein CH280_03110 [Rhodococcus sp. 06-156-4C]OZD36596.1 hypothetical protein CH247_03465 [Rhodococcus sp. 06-156-3b]OZF59315.1 hypothetical protein CH290_21935 [Rhodococcus sp. 06-156-4]